jgi:energy-converting hydrogenase Eha subunit B
MSLSRKRRIADDAAATLTAQRRQLSIRCSGLHGVFDRWRPSILVGGGLVGGYLLGKRQTARLASAAVSLASFGMAVMRTPLGPLAMSALFSNRIGSARHVSDATGSENAS